MAAEVLRGGGLRLARWCRTSPGCARRLEPAPRPSSLPRRPSTARPSRRLAAFLEAQEPWSDLPVVLLTGQGRGAARPLEALSALGNVTLLERPLEIVTLVSATRAAVRARRRQYGARATLLELAGGAGHGPRGGVHRQGWRGPRLGKPLRLGAVRGAGGRELLAPGRAGATPRRRTSCSRRSLEIPLDQIPIERAISSGREIRNAELDLVTAAGEPRHLLGSAAPLRDRGAGDRARWPPSWTSPSSTARWRRCGNRTAGRPSSWRCSRTSCATRWPRSSNAAHLLGLAATGGDQATRAREVIERQSGQLARLVDDLLDLTRIERGKVALEPRRIDLAATVRRTCEDHQQLFADRGMRLEVRPPRRSGSTPTRRGWRRCSATSSRTRHGSAAAGGTTVVETVRAPGAAELRVRDDGVGIAPELLPRLFTPFVQAADSLCRAPRGPGAGAVAGEGPGRASRRHRARPQRRPGARCGVRPHLARPGPARALQRPRRRCRRSSVRCTCSSSRTTWTRPGCSPTCWRSRVTGWTGARCRHGLALARSRVPDVVLCDIGLPDTDGYALARALPERAAALAHPAHRAQRVRAVPRPRALGARRLRRAPGQAGRPRRAGAAARGHRRALEAPVRPVWSAHGVGQEPLEGRAGAGRGG